MFGNFIYDISGHEYASRLKKKIGKSQSCGRVSFANSECIRGSFFKLVLKASQLIVLEEQKIESDQ